MEDAVIAEEIKTMEHSLNGSGRILLRKSGTEPLIRVMVEASTPALCEQYACAVAELIEKRGYMRKENGI